jgi:hypothetical protein
MLGLPPDSGYKILGERTALMAERAMWGISTLYLNRKYLFGREKKASWV